MEIKTFDKIYDDMRNYIIAHQNKLTDFNDGGVLTSQIEAFAREIAMLYVSCLVGFSSYLRELPYSVFGFPMKNGDPASVRVVFSRAKPSDRVTEIPNGTVVSGGGLNFVITATEEGGRKAVIASGATHSQPILARAQKAGDKYNVKKGTIKTIVSGLSPVFDTATGDTVESDIVAVNNPEDATGGTNSEDWAAYIERFADYIVGLQQTNTSGFLTALKDKDIVRSMYVEEHFLPSSSQEDGSGNWWNMTLYLEDGSGGMTNEGLAEAKSIIDGDFSKGINGYRAPGINIRYTTPEVVQIKTRVSVETVREVTEGLDQISIVQEVINEVHKCINKMKIGEPFLRSDLIVLLRRLSSVRNVKIVSPEDDILLHPHQIARYDDCSVTVEA
jgi:hypothetical protein